jgi:CheY-like chemotaxis protein
LRGARVPGFAGVTEPEPDAGPGKPELTGLFCDKPLALFNLEVGCMSRVAVIESIQEVPMSLILHIEDEISVRVLYKEVFEEEGFEIVEALTAEDALEQLKELRPDLIILDLKMPGMGGRRFLKIFQGMNLSIPLVVSSAYPLQEDLLGKGVDAYIVKSGNMRNLVSKVKTLVKQSRNGGPDGAIPTA